LDLPQSQQGEGGRRVSWRSLLRVRLSEN